MGWGTRTAAQVRGKKIMMPVVSPKQKTVFATETLEPNQGRISLQSSDNNFHSKMQIV